MADINNSQAVKFCNERVRLAANKFSNLYWWCNLVAQEWSAQDIASLIPNDASIILDGSSVDGRPIISGADVHTLSARVIEFINLLEADGNLKLNQIVKVSPGPEG